jgi:hypothetical protein
VNDEFFKILAALVAADARFVVVGGVALSLQGSAYLTNDLDIAYERTRENAAKIASALQPFSPRPRRFPKGLPFVFDAQMVLSTQILTLETNVCDVDLLGEISGVGTFAQVDQAAEDFRFGDLRFRILSIDALVASKRAANRPKDEPGLLELEALKEARALLEAEGEPPGGGSGF